MRKSTMLWTYLERRSPFYSNQIRSVKDLDIHAALGLFGDKITFVIGNKIRSVNNFDVTATYS